VNTVQVPNSVQEWKCVANSFFVQWQFPNCIGALDGKHVRILPPPNCGSLYYNYKHFNSIVLLALVDASYKFLYVDVGSYGRISDGGVFNSCSLLTAIESHALQLPADAQLPNSKLTSPHVIVADDAFALKKYIMKPYANRNLTTEQRIYNYRLSRARRVVENAFGIMCSRFRIFSKPVALSPDKIERIVMATCCLHNFLLRNPVTAAQYVPCEIHTSNDLQSVTNHVGKRSTNEAAAVRDTLCSYFNSPEGAVAWQMKAIYQWNNA